jgi:threonine dehydratase
LAARKLGIPATIVMPRTTPAIKIEAARRLGGDVVLHGDTFDDAQAKAREIETERRLTFVYPFRRPRRDCGPRDHWPGGPSAASGYDRGDFRADPLESR